MPACERQDLGWNDKIDAIRIVTEPAAPQIERLSRGVEQLDRILQRKIRMRQPFVDHEAFVALRLVEVTPAGAAALAAASEQDRPSASP